MTKKKQAKKPTAKSYKSKLDKFIANITPKTAALALVVLLLFSTVGVLGYNKVKYGSFTASAYSYSRLGLIGGVKIDACKTQSTRTIRYRLGNTSSSYRHIKIADPAISYAQNINPYSTKYHRKTWSSGYSSVNIKVYVYTVGGNSSLIGSTATYNTNNIRNC